MVLDRPDLRSQAVRDRQSDLHAAPSFPLLFPLDENIASSTPFYRRRGVGVSPAASAEAPCAATRVLVRAGMHRVPSSGTSPVAPSAYPNRPGCSLGCHRALFGG